MCSSARSTGIGLPAGTSPQVTKPTSSSKSRRAEGPNTGSPPGGVDWPHGRRTSVPLATIVPDRP